MLIEEGFLYHIYNQGNNQQKIFFKDDNYLFFLKKIKAHILPYADILAWCLMPNHFHLMVSVKELELKEQNDKVLNNESIVGSGSATKSRTPTIDSAKVVSFNNSIGIMLASYTRAINKQNKTSGSLFRSKTKAECLNCPKGIMPSFITKDGITKLHVSNAEREYPKRCFDYIHQNPVKANLVKTETDWEFSSAKDYAELRNGKLVNKDLAKKLGLI